MRHAFIFAAMSLLLACAAIGQPVIDGTAEYYWYGAALVVQDNATEFGDSDLGRPDWANGSELDAAFGVVDGGVLYLVLAGNLETNWNKIEIFFDTIPGQGQHTLLGAENPDVDYGALQRMGTGADPFSDPGLTFAAGFGADYYVTIGAGGDPAAVHVSYAELYVDEFNLGLGFYLGHGPTVCQTTNGVLSGGDPGVPFLVKCTLDNRNTGGVPFGFEFADGSGVIRGVELAIPLEAIGSPASDFTITAFVNNSSHEFVSNQFLGGLGGGWPNLGEPRWLDLSFMAHVPFTVPISPTALGACCLINTCSVLSQSDCEAMSGTVYLGDRTSCVGNPCDGSDAGRCCIDDGYSGRCEILSQVDCLIVGGSSWTPGEDCDGCPCLLGIPGACCYGDTCADDVRQEDCVGTGGDYVGHYTLCGIETCLVGACCLAHECSDVRAFECFDVGGRYQGSAVFCDTMPCAQTIWTPHVAWDLNGWDAGLDPMTETAPDSGVYTIAFGGLLPHERFEFKITDGTWDLSIPDANSWFYADDVGDIIITYDANEYDDGWAPAWDRIGLSVDPGFWTAVGDFQGWDVSSVETEMLPIGGGIYQYAATMLTPGTHYWKAVVGGTWDAISWNARSVYAADMEFVITSGFDEATFRVDALTGIIQVGVFRDCNVNGIEDRIDLADCDGSTWCDDCNANGIPDGCDIDLGTSVDLDDNGVPDECEGACACGDIDRGGGPVDLTDFATFALCYGLFAPAGDCSEPDIECSDLDGDGVVNLGDFATFAVWYGLESAKTVPDCAPD